MQQHRRRANSRATSSDMAGLIALPQLLRCHSFPPSMRDITQCPHFFGQGGKLLAKARRIYIYRRYTYMREIYQGKAIFRLVDATITDWLLPRIRAIPDKSLENKVSVAFLLP